MKQLSHATGIVLASCALILSLCSFAPSLSPAEDESRDKALERELAQRRKAVRPRDHQARLELLEWMVENKLYQDALSTFDKVLAYSPDEPRALDLLSRVHYKVPLPIAGPYETLEQESLVQLLHYAGSNLPTVQEYVVRLLREYHDQELLRQSLRQLLYTGLERPRAFATLALRRLFPTEFQKDLLRRAVLDRSRKVRMGSALALAKVEEPGILIPVLRALNSEHKLVRQFAAEAVGYMGHEEAIEPLMYALVALNAQSGSSGGVPPASNIVIGSQVSYVSDFNVEIAAGASIADPEISVIGTGALFTARSLGISGYSVVTHRKSIMSSLRRLSGEDAGKRPADWERWWEAKREAQPGPDSAK